ncbi:MAG: GTPase HflX [Bacteroidia bacterium]|nr:GTPase HflX [Bacteroidia bacterium]
MIERTRLVQPNRTERAILVGVCANGTRFEQAKEHLDELAFLTETAGARAVRSFIQRLDHPVHKTYVGPGKLEEIRQAVEEEEAQLVIFDDDLSPSQIRNIDAVLNVKVLDRSSLILYIFSERARTAQARVQVDLAQYQYLLPRLTGMWKHLSRERGGIGLKGAGEKEIETDRRLIQGRITQLKRELEKIDRQESERRRNRSEFVRVALVGYTNVGKSTLMNLLSKSEVLAENKLFATLDTTVRKVELEGIPFLLSDTVGFIRKLPTHLVESFKSTLAEAGESDILLHVVDASHPHFEDQMHNVQETLRGLHMGEKTVLTVFNKTDLLEEGERSHLEASWYAHHHTPAVCISAGERWNIDQLRIQLTSLLVQKYRDKQPGHPFLSLHAYYQAGQDAAPQT